MARTAEVRGLNMQRITHSTRPDWQQRVEDYGLTFHTIEGETYWDESAHYEFTSAEIDTLDDSVVELHKLCLQAVDYVVTQNAFAPFCIPDEFIPLVKQSWARHDPHLYGRFDLAYDGITPPKLLEYNADTPTALLEAAVIQWYWLQDFDAESDQFNSIHEQLSARWGKLHTIYNPGANDILYFASDEGYEEDFITTNYLRDLAQQAGFNTDYLAMQHVGWDDRKLQFVDLEEHSIHRMFKLYPWEWMVHEEFAENVRQETVQWIEPMWKMLLSNKAILPVLWKLNPNHPNLLRTEFEPFSNTFVRKPILAREGANISIVQNGQVILETEGDYAESPVIYQEYHPLPEFSGNFPVCGCWMAGDNSCGLGIREDKTTITKNTSRFVPHLFH